MLATTSCALLMIGLAVEPSEPAKPVPCRLDLVVGEHRFPSVPAVDFVDGQLDRRVPVAIGYPVNRGQQLRAAGGLKPSINRLPCPNRSRSLVPSCGSHVVGKRVGARSPPMTVDKSLERNTSAGLSIGIRTGGKRTEAVFVWSIEGNIHAKRRAKPCTNRFLEGRTALRQGCPLGGISVSAAGPQIRSVWAYRASARHVDWVPARKWRPTSALLWAPKKSADVKAAKSMASVQEPGSKHGKMAPIGRRKSAIFRHFFSRLEHTHLLGERLAACDHPSPWLRLGDALPHFV